MISIFVFFEYCLLFKAIEAQWTIDAEYNIFYEILCVTIVWFVTTSIKNYAWAIDKENLDTGVTFMKLSLVDLRQLDFALATTRSLLCICITTIKNIYDSFTADDIVYLPPDERSIEKLEGVLHNPVAIDYFY